jgi:enoyl-[acyl-carrier protein] reductase I
MYGALKDRAPLKTEFGQDQVAGVALFLASQASAGITAETIFVDNGYNKVGM